MRRQNSIGVVQVVTALSLGLVGGVAHAQNADEYQILQAAREARAAGDLHAAEGYLDTLVGHSPKFAPAYYERALTRHAAGDKTAADDDLARAIELEPKWSAPFTALARWRLDEFDYAGAIEAAVAGGDSAANVELRGNARLALGRHAQALEDFRFLRSGRFGPGASVRYPLALCLMALGQTAEAVDGFQTDYGDGGRIDSRYALNLGYCLLGRYADAEQDLAAWVADSTADPADAQEYDRALRERLRESVDSAHYLTGVVRFARQDFEGAVAALDKIPETSDGSDYARLLQHLARLRAKKTDGAAETLENFHDEWTRLLAACLRGEISEKELLAKAAEPADVAEQRRREGEAAFYAGQERLLAGDEMTARLFFEKTVATGKVELAEYTLAKIALQPPAARPPEQS